MNIQTHDINILSSNSNHSCFGGDGEPRGIFVHKASNLTLNLVEII